MESGMDSCSWSTHHKKIENQIVKYSEDNILHLAVWYHACIVLCESQSGREKVPSIIMIKLPRVLMGPLSQCARQSAANDKGSDRLTNNPNPNLSTMQQYCEVDALFIKWRIGVASMCDAIHFNNSKFLQRPGVLWNDSPLCSFLGTSQNSK